MFSEVPQSQNVTVGYETTFRCNHENHDQIDWIIDGIHWADLPADQQSSFQRSNDGGTLILIVEALPQHNSTVIECNAFVADQQNERTLHAILLVQGTYIMIFQYNNSVVKINNACIHELASAECLALQCSQILTLFSRSLGCCRKSHQE